MTRPIWPMIVLGTPKGWTGPKMVDGKRVEGHWRAHQVPFADVHGHPERLKLLDDWMRSYRPEELFDEDGAPVAEILSTHIQQATRRMGSNPHANGGLLLKDLRLPDFRDYAVSVTKPGAALDRSDARDGQVPARCDQSQRRRA